MYASAFEAGNGMYYANVTGLQTMEARAALGFVSMAATLWLVRSDRFADWSSALCLRRYMGVFVTVRLALFATIFLVLRLPMRGDLPAYYVPELRSMLQGRVPYRDFASSYAPLSSYLNAAVFSVWHSPLVLVVFAIAAESCAMAVWLAVARTLVSESIQRRAALLYLVNPVSLQFVVVDGQNNVVISLLLALACLLLVRRRAALSGVALGLSVALVKFLPLLFVPSFAILSKRRWMAWLAGFAAVVVPVYGYFQLVLRAPVASVLGREGALKTAGGLPYLVEAALGRDLGLRSWDLLLMLLLGGAIAFTAWQALRTTRLGVGPDAMALLASVSGLLLILMAASKKTWPTYLLIVLFPICLIVANRLGLAARSYATVVFALFTWLSVVVHSFWASLLNQISALGLHALMAQGSVLAISFAVLELCLLAGYLWLIRLCLLQQRPA